MRRALVLAVALAAAPAHALDYGRAPAPVLLLDSRVAGQSPGHVLAFSVFRGELQTYRAHLDYPGAFQFRGFDALGPLGTEVGILGFDVDGDGTADHAAPLRSLTPGSAYADVIFDGRFSPALEPVLSHVQGATFSLRLPLGGDADASALVAPFDARVTLALRPGLLVSPRRPGTYVVRAQLVSVDPDTGDGDDGAGAPPTTLALEIAVEIEAPPVVPFAAFCIDRADVKADRFTVHGRYVPGAGSDGVRLPGDTVIVTFGGFEQAIPGTAFAPLGHHGVQFVGREPGVKRLHLAGDGRFQLDARGAGPGAVHREAVPFALQIGDDRGDAVLAFDGNGHLRRRGPPGCEP